MGWQPSASCNIWATGFQTDNVGNVDLCQGSTATGQVTGAKQLKVVRRGVAGEAKILSALTQDFVNDGDRQTVDSETADGQVIAIANQLGNRFGDGGEFVALGTRFRGKCLASAVSGRVGKENPTTLGERLHEDSCGIVVGRLGRSTVLVFA